ncbi:MAG: immunoglobulin-like domain-containing protein [Oleiphilus sp.]
MSAKNIGFISEIVGNAQIRTAEGLIKVALVGDIVKEGEVILTGANSHVVVDFNSGEKVNVGAQAQVTLDDTVAFEGGAFETDRVDQQAALQQLLLDTFDVESLEETAAGRLSSGDDSNSLHQSSVYERDGLEGQVDTRLTPIDDGITTTPLDTFDSSEFISSNATTTTSPSAVDVNNDTISITLNPDISPDDIINALEQSGQVTITGTLGEGVSPGDVVSLTVNGVTTTGLVLADNTFSIDVAGSDLVADADQTIEASITTTDASGASITVNDTESYTVDIVAPTPELTLDAALTTDNILNASELNGVVPVSGTVTGEFQINDVVELTVNGVSYSGTVDAEGRFSIEVQGSDLLADPDSTIDVAFVATDSAGNPSSPVTSSITYSTDITAEAGTVAVNPIADDDIANAIEAGTETIAVSGTATGGDIAAGDEVTVSINGTDYTTTVEADGTYTIDVATADLVADNSIDVSVASTDEAGNPVTSTGSATILADASAEAGTVAVNPIADDDLANAIEAGTETIAVSGTATGGDIAAGDEVTVSINGTDYTTTVDADGTYTIDVATADLVADNSIDVSVASTDEAGNPVTSTGSATILADTSAEAGTVAVNPIADDDLANAIEAGTETIAVSGTATGGDIAAGDEVTVSINGTDYTTTVEADGTYTIDVATADLVADNSIDVTVASSDEAGNPVSSSGSATILADTTAEAGTVAVNTIAGDDIINASESGAATIAVSGTATGGDISLGDTVTVTVNGTEYQTIVGAGGAYSVNVETTDLIADNTIDVTVASSDDAGNPVSSSGSATVSVDTTAKAGTVAVNTIAGDDIINASESGAATIAVSGTATGGDISLGDTVTVTVNGTEYQTTVGAGGAYTIDVATADLVADNSIDVTVASSDAAGNPVSSSGSATVSVDTTAEAGTVAVNTIAGDDIINASESGAATIAVSGTATGGDISLGDTVTVTVNGTEYQTTVGAGGAYSVNVETTDLIADNTIDVIVESNDPAGNSVTSSGSSSISLDINVVVSLEASSDITEAGGTVTYTATLDNTPATDMSVVLDNGETITIAAGSTSGSIDIIVSANEDAVVDAASLSATITSTSGGGFGNVVIDSTPAVTTISDTIDTTTVSLSATGSITEAGGTVTYTATVDNAPASDLTVSLNNGETITIAAGETSGTVDVTVAENEDAIAESASLSAAITGTTGGGLESVSIDATPAVTTISDTVDTTTVSLSATGSITEAGGTVTYTASVDNAPASDLTVSLNNGETITIAAGETTGTVDVTVAENEDAIAESASLSAAITGTTGGGLESVSIDATPAVTTISDTIDTTTVSLSATGSITEAGGTVTYTATVDNAPASDLTVSLNNGETITIAAGETSGTVDVTVAADEDAIAESASISAAISGTTGGGLESVSIDTTPAVTTISDTIDTTTVSLSATASITEAGGTVTYTATVDNATASDMTVNLDNGETIIILAGETSGAVDVTVSADEDAVTDASSIFASISSTSGGGLESVSIDSTPAVTTITDTIDTTTVSLSATASITEAGGTVTYTATVDNAPASDLTVSLNSGETITIAAGATTGTVDVTVAADEDAIAESASLSAAITGTTGGGLESVSIDTTPAVTTISDTIDITTVSLSATASITEAGGTVTYTASVDNAPASDLTVSLNNGETITIAAGETSGTVDVTVAANEDAIAESASISAAITGTTGGGLESVSIDATPAVTTITDTVDTTTVSLSATGSITEAGGTVTYTATVDNAPASDLTVSLNNGETITIAAGETTGTVDVTVVADEDAIAESASISAVITGTTGGGLESVSIDSTPAVTTITDTIDTTTVSLSATGSISEAGGTVTYTATVDNATASDMTVNLDNGETITILAGETSGAVDVTVSADEDAVTDASSIFASISSTSGGGLESVSIDSTPAVTTISDTIDTTTVSLSATGSITEAGGTVTYTASVDNAPASDLTVSLNNGETITIAAGETSGTVDVTVAANEDAIAESASLSAAITGTTGGGLESVSIDATPAVTTISDTIDITTVSLSATASITEAGGTVTYTASVDNAPASDLTVSLNNGETITIAAGETSGTVDVTVAANEDAIAESASISAAITGTTGGGLESVSIDATPAVTTITDTVDTTTVSLSATGSITEAGGTVTYTATVDNAPGSDLTVSLNNGETITIAAGETTGTVDVTVASDEDAIAESTSISAAITGTTGGGLESLSIDATPAVTTITDTVDTTTVSLSATASITEAGGTVTYTASLDNAPASDLTVSLNNGETITIAAGETTGTVDVTVASNEDAIAESSSISATITSTSGGGLESVSIDATPAVTSITDTIDTTTVSLSATGSITEAGGTVTYTASVDNAPASDLTVSLNNGETITIAAGETTGTVDVTVAANEDAIAESASLSASITGTTGGGLESVSIDTTPAVTTISDTIDTTTVSLSATGSITEAGGTVTYTASVDNAPASDLTVSLNNGETITIAAGETTGTVDVTVAANEDAIAESASLSAAITGTTGGGLESVSIDATPAVTTISDTIDTTTVSLSATGSITEAGGTVTYTASVDNAPASDLTVSLNNGETITIAAGATTGTVAVTVAADEDAIAESASLSASITGTRGGGLESVSIDTTPAVTTISDTIDTTTVSLSATGSITEAGGTVTYTASVDNAPASDLTVSLNNGETITIAAGETSGTVDVTVAANEDAIAETVSLSAAITGTTGGGLESVSIDATPAVTTITDTVDTTTVSLSATGSITEAGGTVTYTASLDNAPASDLTVSLNNGETITIAAGATTGTVDVTVAANEDAIAESASLSAAITGTTGGGLESVSIDSTPAVTTISDTIDTTTVSLSATGSITEAGGTVTYTASVDNAPASDLTVSLNNGETITIAAGETSGTVDVTVAENEDAIAESASISAAITGTTGGGLESVSIDATPAVTTITDTVDTTTVSLSATGSITEAGGTVTYTATVDNAPGSDLTVSLNNGETITIAAGETTGTVDVTVASDEDAIAESASISAVITGTTGGGLESVSIDSTPAVTTITDTIDTTTVSLSATGSISEAGGTVTYTATVDNATASDMTVNLDNGETITILAGETSGAVDVTVAANEDAVTDASSIFASISSTSGGGLESVSIDSTPAVTTISDTIDTTTVSLSATGSITEAGGTVTYTATVDNAPASDLTVSLNNGETITIAAGETSGTVDVTVAADEDAIAESASISAAITGTTGGGLESVSIDATPAVTNITDTIDTTTVSLSATGSITEAGGTVTYTASVDNAPASDLTVSLNNGETITIAAGATTGTVDVVVAANEDAIAESASISAAITGTTGGGLESVSIDTTPAVTTISDTVDTTTVSLSATGSITEAGGTVTYTATVDNAAASDLTVSLNNGESITIAAGETSGTVDVTVAENEDAIAESASISAAITGTTGGGLESVSIDATPAVTNITDTIDTTTVSLSATADITEAGGTVTYTASVDNAPASDLTVSLNNGETITIAAGETSGTVDVTVAANEDAIAETSSISATITATSGGGLESVSIDTTPAVTTISDTIDITTVSLSATASITEAGGTVTYTASVDNAPASDLTVSLNNGETITIAAGETTGTVDVTVAANEDAIAETASISAAITGTTGGGLESVSIDATPAVTTISDTIDTTTVSLSATGSITEAGGTVTYTASVDNAPASDLTVSLNNGETITIAAGETSGTVDVTVAANEDAIAESASLSAAITGTTGGGLESVSIDATPAVTTITDTVDTTTVSLSATASITEAGGTVTYTATVDNAPASDLTVSLNNGETITIAAGATTGTVDVTVAANEDAIAESASLSAAITGTTGGGLESVSIDATPAVTTITDTVDTTTVSLSATGSITEAGGTVTYTASLDNAPASDLTVSLNNGETITIAAGETTGTVDVTVASNEDAIAESSSISATITATSGGGLESVSIDATPAVTSITDTIDTTTVSLSATGSITEAGGTVTYTASVDNAPASDLTVSLNNGETITIAAGETSGTVDVTVAADEDAIAESASISAAISGTTGGGLESVSIDATPAVTNITDTIDTTTVSLSATGSITEAGGTVTYTASVDNAPASDLTVNLNNGETITIAAGETSGTVDVTVAANEDAIAESASLSAAITGTTGGGLESVSIDATPAVTTISDTIDTTTVSLSATGSITEAGGTVTYTASVDNAPASDLTVSLNNGETIIIAAGTTTGTVAVTVAADEDAIAESASLSASITGTTGGGLESVSIDTTPAVTTISDTIDTTTVSLSATGSITEAGGTVTYTASVDNAPASDLTVSLNNGETITIAAGETSGTVDVTVAANEDAIAESASISAAITGTTGGGLESVSIDATPAVTNITDTIDTTTVSLSATASITEAGGTVTYTASLDNAPASDLTVSLNNGETITIAAGETTGTVDVTVASNEDAIAETSSISATITATSGGGLESVSIDATPAVTSITDTIDTTTVSLSATGSITEAGGTVTYTASVDNAPASDLTVSLNNGETITIAAGETTGTVDVTVAANEDAIAESASLSAAITGTTGGGLESVSIDTTPAVTTISDTIDTTTVSLSATGSITEAGGTVTYTASVDNAPASDLTVSLNNGETITIAAGETSGTVDVTVAANEDAIAETASISAAITGTTGGGLESVSIDATPAVTTVSDTIDTTTVSLSATGSITEAGGTVTYTASVDNAPASDLTVSLNNGETITIAAGETSGTVDVTVAADEDAIAESASLSAAITGTTGGGLESVSIDATPAVTTISDTIDATTVSLSATASITEAGGTVTYTASVDNAPGSDLTVSLNNGETITIAAGETTGTVDVTVAANEDAIAESASLSAAITGTTGGGLESVSIDATPAVTTITDTIDTTTVSLSATASITEAGGTVTYTATVDNAPASDLTVSLNNGETITIAAGETTGTVDVTVAANEDAIAETSSISATITATSGGGLESVSIDATPAVTNITDTVDTTTVSLSATGSITEAGGTVTYTATVDNAPASDLTVSLNNGETITIAAGETTGTVDVTVAANEDAIAESASLSAAITGTTGGGLESVSIDATPAVTTITDTIDTTTVSLSATGSITEAGGTVTYTATVDNAPASDLTVSLNNGETITIAAGETTGTVDVTVAANEDAIAESASLSAAITGTTGGGLESVSIDATPAVTTITDTLDTTTVSLSATADITEAGGTVTYTASVDNAPASDLTVNLNNGETITIAAGATTGTVDVTVAANEDAIAESASLSVAITGTTGGGLESVSIDATPAVTTITDTIDITTVSLSATASITEAGGTVTYTASVDNAPASDLTVSLNNGETITIAAGETSGTVDVTVAANEDAIAESASLSAAITGTTGGGLESVSIDATPAVTTITDTVDTTTVSLSATGSITEAGGTVTYTATVDNAPASDLTVSLNNGETITIAAGETTGTVDVSVAANEDAIAESASISAAITGTTGGGLESVSIDATPAVTNITDTVDTTTVGLSATASITEAGGTVTYTASVDNAPASDLTVSLNNGETITIAAGATTGTVDVVVAANEDAIAESASISAAITGTTGGGLESVSIDATSAVTTIADTVDTTTVSLSATGSITEAGGTVTYTASVDNAPASDLTVSLNNGETITIAAGETSGTVDVTVAANEDAIAESASISAAITGTTGGGLESVSIDTTPAVTTITDTVDTTTVSLSATGSITEAGGTVTYTATVDNAPASDLTVSLNNGETITIAAGETTGTVDVTVASNEDAIAESSSISATITATSGGGLESVSIDATPAVTNITDTVDTTTVSLSATGSITEAGGTVTYTATVDNAPASDLTVSLNNGETITIAAGATTGTVDVTVAANEDAIAETASISAAITGTTGGGLESVSIDSTPAVTTISDTIDTTTVSLSATASITEAGGTVTYTASVDNAPASDLTVSLNNGETITIAAGATTGTVDVTVAANEDAIAESASISAAITGTTGGGLESVSIDATPAVTTITDTVDTTTVSLDATGHITTLGGTVTYTASVDNAPATDMTVSLNNGEVITIAAGATSGSIELTVDPAASPIAQSALIINTSGGSLENVAIDAALAEVQVTSIVVNSITNDDILNAEEASGSVAVTGSVEGDVSEGDAVALTVNNVEYTGTVDIDGNYSINVLGSDLAADSTISASLTGTDSAGIEFTAETESTHLIDLVAEAGTVIISTIADDDIINASESGAASIAVSGTATGGDIAFGDKVTVTVNGTEYNTTVGLGGAYSVDVATADLIADNSIDVGVDSSDAAGNTVTSTGSASITVDTTADAGTINIQTIANDNVINATEAGELTIAVSGTASGGDISFGDEVTVTVNGNEYTTTVGTGGAFSVDVDTTDLLADLSVDVSVLSSDAAGNSVTSTGSALVTLDMNADPGTVTVNTIAGDDIINATESSAATIEVSGVASGGDISLGDAVTVTVNGTEYDTTVGAAGAYSVNVATTDLIADNSIEVAVESSDLFENTVTSTGSATITVDTDLPTISINAISVDNVVTDIEDNAVVISGTTTDVEDDQLVTVNVAGTDYTVAVSNNTWTLPAIDMSGFTDGATFAITADVSDAVGNAAVQATASFSTLDTTAPTISIASIASDDVVDNLEDNAVLLSGTTTGVETDQTVTVQIVDASGDAVYSGVTQVLADGSWNIPNVDLSALPDGTAYSVLADVSDVAGNPAVQASRGFDNVVNASDDIAIVHESALSTGSGNTESVFDSNDELSQNAGEGVNTATGNLLSNDTGGSSILNINGNTPDGSGVITVTGSYGELVVDAATGDYTYTLNGAADNSAASDNDSILENFSYTNNLLATSNLDITIVDDAPAAQSSNVEAAQNEMSSFNLMLMLDVSTSMTNASIDGVVYAPDGSTATRLDIAKQSLIALGQEYFQQSTDVEIKVGVFAGGSYLLNGGTAYTDFVSFEAAVNAITDAAGDVNISDGTNYESALDTMEANFNVDASGENISYFLSDGAISRGSTDLAIDTNWVNFASANNIDSFSVGIGTGLTNFNDLNYIHNVDSNGDGTTDNALVVPDLAQLDSVLLETVPDSFGGSVVSNDISSAVFGADGGYVQSVSILLDTDGNSATPDQLVNFTFDPTANSGQGGISNDAGLAVTAGSVLTLTSADGFAQGSIIFDFSDGNYNYFVGSGVNEGDSFNLDYTLADGDGDVSSTETLAITIVNGVPQANDDLHTINLNDTSASGNVISGIGTDGGVSLSSSFTSFATQGEGVDEAVDNAVVTSIDYRGDTIDLTSDLLVAQTSTASDGTSYTYTVSGGELNLTNNTDGSALEFHSTGFYEFTPASGPVAQTATTVVEDFTDGATGNGVNLTAMLDTTLTYNGTNGLGITGGTGIYSDSIDGGELLEIAFDPTVYAYGVQNVVFDFGWDNSSGTLRIFHIDGSELGAIALTGADQQTVPLEYSNIGKITLQAGSAGDYSIQDLSFDPILLDTSSTAAEQEIIGYTLTDEDGSSSSATLTLNTVQNSIAGTVAGDTLSGTDLNDRIVGQAGDDTISGGDGNDVLEGGDGGDTLYGQAGNDLLSGGIGMDILDGGEGNDTLKGGDDNDQLFGGAGDDSLSGDKGSDTLFGGTGDDSLMGGAGIDLLYGGEGNDSLEGGAGSDTFVWQNGDAGTILNPTLDTISDFSAAAGGDKLDLSNLLQGEDSGSLTEYLHFDSDGHGGTMVSVDVDGGGSFETSQQINLVNVDLTAGGTLSDQDIINNLLANENIIVDL